MPSVTERPHAAASSRTSGNVSHAAEPPHNSSRRRDPTFRFDAQECRELLLSCPGHATSACRAVALPGIRRLSTEVPLDLPVESRSRRLLGVAERRSHRRGSASEHHGASQRQYTHTVGSAERPACRLDRGGWARRSPRKGILGRAVVPPAAAGSRDGWCGRTVGVTEYTEHQAISPLLRSDFAQSTVGRTPHGDLTDSFVPSDGRAAQ